jgi:ABC-2 type transport system permease protein
MFGMGGRQPPPIPRADGGKATSLMKALGIMWDSGFPSTWDGDLVVVFDNFNPHPRIKDLVPPEFVFISPESGVSSAFSPDSKITGGFQQMLALFTGRIKRVKGATKLEFEPLLRTGVNSGEIPWSKMVDQDNPFSGPQIKRNLIRISDDEAHTLAAHIHSQKKQGGINVVYVADLDIISDYALFRLAEILRRGFDYELQLDNVEFVLNAVDLLAGDVQMIDLRSRKARMRPLTEIQKEVNGFRKQRQQAEEDSQKEWETELAEIQQQLDDAQAELGDDPGRDLQRLFTAAETATRKLNQKKREIEQEQQQTLDSLKGKERRQIDLLETRIRWQAVLLPPIPAIILGILVLGIRLYREESTIKPSRSVKK